MEYIDVYDKQGNKQDKVLQRGTKLKENEYVLIVHLWIQHKSGAFLIQKRAKADDPTPYQWAITTGVALAGETAVDAVIREAHEELGLVLNTADLIHIDDFTSKRESYQTLTHMFLAKASFALSDLVLNKAEVSEVAWCSLEKIYERISKNTFWNYPHLMNVPDYFRRLEKSL